VLLLTVLSCAKLDKTAVEKSARPAAESIRFETRDSLLQWHDETYKSYYGLKGPVEQLVMHPVHAGAGEIASDGWNLWFNQQGRLTRKQRLAAESEPEFETVFEYNEDDQTLARIVSRLDKKPWRSSEYIYEAGQLIRVDYWDHTNNDTFRVKRGRLTTVNGRFDSQLPVEKIEMPGYQGFGRQGELTWSNKGDINNGLGEMYFIRTVDGVTSSSVVNPDTQEMAGRGGYRYHYYDNGLLKAVESYNAHNNRLFHVTLYQYDDLWLLLEENREVRDSSVFNQVVPEKVEYDYRVIDSHGNWLHRTLRYSSKFQQQLYDEKRSISYFNESSPGNDG
jgi:phage antirepressor YoqD-like protein